MTIEKPTATAQPVTDLEVIRTKSGGYFVRPKGEVGTCGWSPKAWQIAAIRRYEIPMVAFLNANRNWVMSDIGFICKLES